MDELPHGTMTLKIVWLKKNDFVSRRPNEREGHYRNMIDGLLLPQLCHVIRIGVDQNPIPRHGNTPSMGGRYPYSTAGPYLRGRAGRTENENVL